jgi:hypothetical protein
MLDADVIAMLVKVGTPVGGLSLLAVAWLARRLRESERRVRSEMRGQNDGCEKRNLELSGRITELERRQFEQLETLAKEGLLGLAYSTQVIKRFCRDNELTPPGSKLDHDSSALNPAHHLHRQESS